MTGVSWEQRGADRWLVASRPESHPVVAGVGFGAGTLHQPTEHLGVAGLLAAWLGVGLGRPVEALDPDAHAGEAQVSFLLDETDSALLLTGDADGVRAALRRLEGVLAAAENAVDAEIDDTLRHRARAFPSALRPWLAHLTARWPGHRPHLAALGPLALDTLDAAALRAYAAGPFGRAPRVYFTNEPEIRAPSAPSAAAGRAGDGGTRPDPEPSGWRETPGCVLAQHTDELFSTAAREGPATRIALTLLARALHRRLVEFQPLASAVRLDALSAGGEVLLVCGTGELLPGQGAQAREAVVQTLEDLADGSLPAAGIGRIRDRLAGAARLAAPHEPEAMLALVREQLRRGNLPTPGSMAREREETGDGEVRAVLGRLYPQLLLSVALEDVADPPLPMAQRTMPRPAEGRRFRSRLVSYRWARCSPRRVGVVERTLTAAPGKGRRTRAEVTRQGVDFAEVVLRLDAGEQSTTLIDAELYVAEFFWDEYRGGAELRELVAERTPPEVPVVRRSPDPGRTERVAESVRRARRRALGTAAAFAVPVSVLVTLIALGAGQDDAPLPGSDAPVVRNVTAGTPVELPNGTRMSITAGPEVIEHVNAETPYSYALRLRICGGEIDDAGGHASRGARNSFDPVLFDLIVDGAVPPGFTGGTEGREPVPWGQLKEGECAAGWAQYRLHDPPGGDRAYLRYTGAAGDQVTWTLPRRPPTSPLSKPCPTRGSGVQQPWAGCPWPLPE